MSQHDWLLVGLGVGVGGFGCCDGWPVGVPDGSRGDPEGLGPDDGSVEDVAPSEGVVVATGGAEPAPAGAPPPVPVAVPGGPVPEVCASVTGTVEGLSTGPGRSMSWLDEGFGAGAVVTSVASRT